MKVEAVASLLFLSPPERNDIPHCMNRTSLEIVPMLRVHWPSVREIYLEGINTSNATFEIDAPSWEKFDESHHQFGRLVAQQDEQLLGWAALSPVSRRAVYAGVAEVSVYVAASARGRGCGRALLNLLIEESERNRIWTLQAGIFPENIPSLELHKSSGFRVVGVRERIGQMNGVWRDTVLLERRSNVE
jgi:phosphinothricin acetyltransferase